jgi:hypothetical protein
MFKLSSRELVQMMAERGIALAHTTILRWVQRYVPGFEKRWRRYALPVGDSRRVDETYLKVRGQWIYLYRAVDKTGRTVDFLLSKKRNMGAAQAVLFPGDEAARRTAGDHPGRLRRLAPGGRQTQGGWKLAVLRAGTLQQVPQQCGGARPPADKATNPADARVQALRDRGRDDPRHLSWRRKSRNTNTTSNPSPAKAPPLRKSGPRYWPLKIRKPFAREKHTLNEICTRTLRRCRRN